MYTVAQWRKEKARRIDSMKDEIEDLRLAVHTDPTNPDLAADLAQAIESLIEAEAETYEQALADYNFERARARQKGEDQ